MGDKWSQQREDVIIHLSGGYWLRAKLHHVRCRFVDISAMS